MSIKLEVWGDKACFTRPEAKVERLSYDVMTPSAARGLIEAIYWHPGMRYVIDKIQVCAPIRFTTIRQNEVSEIMNPARVVRDLIAGKDSYIVASECRTQRATTLLRDVRYVIEAHFEMTAKASANDSPDKFQGMLTERIAKGRFYQKPCFGIREFPAEFQKCERIPECPKELLGEIDLGLMLLDGDYSDPANVKPVFFHAIMRDGAIEVPRIDSKEAIRTL